MFSDCCPIEQILFSIFTTEDCKPSITSLPEIGMRDFTSASTSCTAVFTVNILKFLYKIFRCFHFTVVFGAQKTKFSLEESSTNQIICRNQQFSNIDNRDSKQAFCFPRKSLAKIKICRTVYGLPVKGLGNGTGLNSQIIDFF